MWGMIVPISRSELCEGPSEVLQHLPIHEFEVTLRTHCEHEARNVVDNQFEIPFVSPAGAISRNLTGGP